MVLIGCLQLQNKTLVNRVQDMSHKVINHGVLTRFGALVYQAPESYCFIAPRAIGSLVALFNV